MSEENGPESRTPGKPRKARTTPRVEGTAAAGSERRAIGHPQAPESRPVHRHGFAPELINKRADRAYVLAHPGSGFFGPAMYEGMGYQVVQRSEDGPGFAFGQTNGMSSAVEYHGHVLMEAPIEVAEQVKQHGAFGGGGQDYIDELEGRFIDHASHPDASRGVRQRRGDVPLEDWGWSDSSKERSIAHPGKD